MKPASARSQPPKKLWSTVGRLLRALPLALAAALLIALSFFGTRKEPVYLELRCQALETLQIGLNLDDGGAYFAEDFRYTLEGGRRSRLQMRVPEGRFRALRISLPQVGSKLTLLHSELRSTSGGLLDFDIDQWTGKALASRAGSKGSRELESLSSEACLELHASKAPALRPDLIYGFRQNWPWVLALTFLFAAASLLPLSVLSRIPFLRVFYIDPERNPRLLLALVALGATIAALHPLLFGRSLVSPHFGAAMAYESPPYLPGGDAEAPFTSCRGADIGALMWQHMPSTAIQHRALFQDLEWPLWNRYSDGGITLIGQGQSMLGDPLHLPTILAGGEAWAFDLKFALYRFLFCYAIGLCLLRTGAHWKAAALGSLAACFIGFFNFRLNHPAVFSACLSPWVLLAWLELGAAKHLRAQLRAGILLSLSTLALLCSGTVKEAYVLCACLQCVGFLTLLRAHSSLRERALGLGIGLASVLSGILLCAPVWLSFLDALAKGASLSDAVSIQRLPINSLACLPDDGFWRSLLPDRLGCFPTLNYLCAAGVAWVLVQPRLLWANRFASALLLGMIGSALLAYDFLPEKVIAAIPFVNRLGHLHNLGTLSLVVCATVLAGLGFDDLRTRARQGVRKIWIPLTLSAVLLGGLLLLWLRVNSRYFGGAFDAVSWSADWKLLGDYYPALLGCLLALGLLGSELIRLASSGQSPRPLVLGLCLIVLLQRGGLVFSGDDFHQTTPKREAFQLPSETLESLKPFLAAEPGRILGLRDNLLPSYPAVHGLESIAGPDAVQNRYFMELMLASGAMKAGDWRFRVEREAATFQRPLLSFLNVRFLLGTATEDPKLPGFIAGQRGDLQVFTNPSVWPRAYFTNRIRTYHGPKDLLDLITAEESRPFCAIQHSASAKPEMPQEVIEETHEAAQNYRITNNTISFQVLSRGPGFLVLQESWTPDDFEVLLDGQPAEVVRVNHCFRGLRVERDGMHQVSYRYHPRVFRLALPLCGLGLGLLVGTFLWQRRLPKIAVSP